MEALRERNADVVVHDPMYNAAELNDFGWNAYQLGESVDAVIVQADHDEYKSISPEDFPGIRAIFDGRRITDAEKWNGTPRLTIG